MLKMVYRPRINMHANYITRDFSVCFGSPEANAGSGKATVVARPQQPLIHIHTILEPTLNKPASTKRFFGKVKGYVCRIVCVAAFVSHSRAQAVGLDDYKLT